MAAPLLKLAQYHHVNEQVVAVLSIFANSMFFTVLMRETNETLRPYARVLLLNCTLDLLYTAASVACEMQTEFWNGYIIMNVQNPLLRSAPASSQYLIFWTWSMVLAITINSSPLLFYFRYMLVCKSQRLNVGQVLRILTIPIGYSALEVTSIIAALIQHNAERATLCRRLMSDIFVKPVSREYSPEKCMLSNVSNPFLMFFFGATFAFDIAIYSTMLSCSYAIYRAMKRNGSIYSRKTSQLQRQMNFILIAQMIVPLFTAIVPGAVQVTLPILKIDARGTGTVMNICMSWVPLVSPITTILFVANFRRRAIRYLCFFTKRLQQRSTTTSNQSSTNIVAQNQFYNKPLRSQSTEKRN